MKRNNWQELYKKIKFPNIADRPFFYSNFVTSLDGKVWVKKEGYWPIGSKIDYNIFTYIRSLADAIVDGKGTAVQFAQNTFKTIAGDDFIALRQKNGKSKDVKYIVLTAHIDTKLIGKLKNPYDIKPIIITTQSARCSKEYEAIAEIVRLSSDTIDPFLVSCQLYKRKIKTVFIDGGPHVLTSFFKDNLVDELFLTITPKFFGNSGGQTLTLGEGELFSPQEIKKFKLLSSFSVGDELFLRYQRV